MRHGVLRAARHGALMVVLLLALVVAALPGTTSAAAAPAQPRDIDPPPAPILLEVGLEDLTTTPSPDSAAAVPAPEPPAAPPLPPSYFEQAMVVSLYGHPGVGTMGELGLHDPEGAVRQAERVADEYRALLGPQREVIAALHLIVDVAQPVPMQDGSYLERMGLDEVMRYVAVARQHDILLFLDLQVGWTVPVESVQRLETALREPFVHLALDPEFATKPKNGAPGAYIGLLGPEQVNPVQEYLARLVREEGLPPKILVLHQFTPGMLVEPEDFAEVPEVEISIDMDGYGAPAPKFGGYERYALAPYSERPAIKLFYHWDEPLIPARDLLSLERPPDYVIYQ